MRGGAVGGIDEFLTIGHDDTSRPIAPGYVTRNVALIDCIKRERSQSSEAAPSE